MIASFYPEAGAVTEVLLSPDGSRAYFTANGTDAFGSGGVVAVDTATDTVVSTTTLGVLPGQIAIAPDGSRFYVGVGAVWVNTGYGAAFIPGRFQGDTGEEVQRRADPPSNRGHHTRPTRDLRTVEAVHPLHLTSERLTL